MFDRFIRLAKARKALRDERYEEALQLAMDPLVADDRRAEDLRGKARDQLLRRAERRIDEGDLAGAAALVKRLQALGDHPRQAALHARIESLRRDDDALQGAAQQGLEEVRALLRRGCTKAAEELSVQRRGQWAAGDLRRVEQEISAARQRARENIAAADGALAGGDAIAALALWRRAAALDDGAVGLEALRDRLEPVVLDKVRTELTAAIARHDLVGGLAIWRSHAAPGGFFSPESAKSLASSLIEGLRVALRSADLAGAVSLARVGGDLPGAGEVTTLLTALRRADSLGSSAEAAGAWDDVAASAAEIGAKVLRREAQQAATRARDSVAQLADARAAVAAGNLERAAEGLRALLVAQPLHEVARRELDVVEQGLKAQADRLDAARTAARQGDLARAASLAAALAGASHIGTEAAGLLADVRARMAVVDRGVDEVRVALHGRAAAGVEGVRHCLRRLQALRDVQRDNQAVEALQRAVEAEIEGLELWERATNSAERGDFNGLTDALAEFHAMRPKLLAEDRLDARFAELADRLHALAEARLARGDLGSAERAAAELQRLAGLDGQFGAHAKALLTATAAARRRAADFVARARERFGSGDLIAAGQLVDEAEAVAADEADVRALRAELSQLGHHEAVLARAAELARQRDFGGANQKLAELPPTPAMLRTRIYDMKQSLAKAQGLQGAFLLRVDEGGECLVMRGESVSIGNVRQTRADLPLLANLAGRHASIRRSLSFHGGMQDVVVAEEGEVDVGGEKVSQRALRPGDRVQLGSALSFVYSQPSGRSLSAVLQLQGGFQIAGTDRVVLMKDRGKDGRLLLGPGRDCHVRVASASGEVELFATNTGQVRVSCAAGGQIDGKAFRGEHPVDAGQIVEAAGLSFVLLPWTAAS